MEKKRAFSMSIVRGVIVAGMNDTANMIAKLMERHNIGAVVIVKGERVVGIISERDITRRVVAKDLNPQKLKAKNFMTTDVVTADFEKGLDSIYQILCKAKFRHLPIVHKGKLVGIASQRDVLYGIKKI
ncbi:MAG: CBS domain-containing protein [Candidatus Omnitrophica bacterium]|nr:CBS domain-containing protein [Candidatus Omnitrophota bacterium]